MIKVFPSGGPSRPQYWYTLVMQGFSLPEEPAEKKLSNSGRSDFADGSLRRRFFVRLFWYDFLVGIPSFSSVT
jgi:hypothetical protein